MDQVFAFLLQSSIYLDDIYIVLFGLLCNRILGYFYFF